MTDTRWCAQHNCPSSLCGGSHREFREEQRRRAAPLIAEELRRLADVFWPREDESWQLFTSEVAERLRARADELDPP